MKTRPAGLFLLSVRDPRGWVRSRLAHGRKIAVRRVREPRGSRTSPRRRRAATSSSTPRRRRAAAPRRRRRGSSQETIPVATIRVSLRRRSALRLTTPQKVRACPRREHHGGNARRSRRPALCRARRSATRARPRPISRTTRGRCARRRRTGSWRSRFSTKSTGTSGGGSTRFCGGTASTRRGTRRCRRSIGRGVGGRMEPMLRAVIEIWGHL